MNTQGSTQIMYSEILLGMTTTFFFGDHWRSSWKKNPGCILLKVIPTRGISDKTSVGIPYESLQVFLKEFLHYQGSLRGLLKTE